jgi:hypothetical protein
MKVEPKTHAWYQRKFKRDVLFNMYKYEHTKNLYVNLQKAEKEKKEKKILRKY